MLRRLLAPANSLLRTLRDTRPKVRRRKRLVVSAEPLECRVMLSGEPVLADFAYTMGTNAEVSGYVTNDTGSDTSLEDVNVQFDLNNDGSFDLADTTDSMGTFFTDLGTLTNGDIQVRVGDADGWSDWVPQSLNLPPVGLPPEIASIDYEAGTLAKLNGSITNENGIEFIDVEIDLDGDGFADQITWTNANGDFSMEFAATSGEEMTVHLRAIDLDGAGVWSEYTFTPVNNPPSVTSLELLNDTGSSSTDNITSDGTITGTISNDGNVAGILIEIDLDDDGFADVTTTTDSNGNFTIDLTPYLTEGSVTVKVRAVEFVSGGMLEGAWTSLTFTLEGGGGWEDG